MCVLLVEKKNRNLLLIARSFVVVCVHKDYVVAVGRVVDRLLLVLLEAWPRCALIHHCGTNETKVVALRAQK